MTIRHHPRIELDKKFKSTSIIGKHPKLIKVLKLATLIADTEATILIYGESGTGKELLAHAIHNNSNRRNNPFIPLNCGALQDNLLESELFGHNRGAFTGAFKEKQGWFGFANGGTIFLDELQEMTSALQMKLLRVLQTGQYSPVGSTEIKKSNVRILAATSKNLNELIEKGNFREELFYRLNVIDITLPPLRERKSDIPLLIQYYLRKFVSKYEKGNLRFLKEVENQLCTYHFPGNIRELRNIIERAVILAEEGIIESDHLPDNVVNRSSIEETTNRVSPFKEAKRVAIEKFERGYITECLRMTKGNISHAALKAGIHVTHFYSKMKQYDINPHSFKINQ